MFLGTNSPNKFIIKILHQHVHIPLAIVASNPSGLHMTGFVSFFVFNSKPNHYSLTMKQSEMYISD